MITINKNELRRIADLIDLLNEFGNLTIELDKTMVLDVNGDLLGYIKFEDSSYVFQTS